MVNTFPRSPLKLPDALTLRWVKRPGDLDLWPFDLESGVLVTCDVGYLCANFSLPRPLCSRLRPDVCNRQTDVIQTDVRQHHRLMPHIIAAGIINASYNIAHCEKISNCFGLRTLQKLAQNYWQRLSVLHFFLKNNKIITSKFNYQYFQ